MAENGKAKGGTKLSTVLYFTCLTLAVMALVFFLYLLLVDGGLFLFGYVFSPYTLAFAVIAFVFLLRTGDLLKRNGGKVSYHGTLAAAAAVIALAAAVYGGVRDIRHTRTADMLVMSGRNALLTEYTEKNGTTGKDNTFIDAHILYGRIAMKLGRIDETYFSNKCVEKDLYAYSVNDTENVLTIECEYGDFGDGVVALDPSHDKSTIKYDFKLR